MKQFALILIMLAMATAAQASDDSSSLFACGINFGGKQLTFASSSETEPKEKKKDWSNYSRLDRVIGAVRTQPAQFTLPQQAATIKPEKRLPPKLTFATVGCSWR
jgi:hypothetical protein